MMQHFDQDRISLIYDQLNCGVKPTADWNVLIHARLVNTSNIEPTLRHWQFSSTAHRLMDDVHLIAVRIFFGAVEVAVGKSDTEKSIFWRVQ